MGLSSVVLMGHDDGGLLSLMAAERAQSCRDVHQVEVKGVVLVGVSLTREVVPAFARILLYTSLGKHMLRPLLRIENVIHFHHAFEDSDYVYIIMELCEGENDEDTSVEEGYHIIASYEEMILHLN